MDQIGRLGIDFYSLIVYFVNFGVIYFFAGKYIVKPLIKNIDTRTKKIQSSLEEANELKKQIEEDQKALKTEKREYSLKLNAQITKIKQELNKEAQE
ncbi:hypothetical protein COV24_02375, partial [candidate division WWE3 bacterium CG10_big_fil_rev_8_21_14_0_10_32_10]